MNTLNRFQALLKENECAVVLDSVSRRYLTGFSSTDGALLVFPESAVLYVDSRYAGMARAAKEKGRVPREITLSSEPFMQAFAALSAAGTARIALFEDRRLTVAQLARMEKQFPATRFQPMGDRIESLRLVKTEDEIARIRAAQALSEEALAYVLERIEPGRSESDIAADLEYYMKSHGAAATSFETICVAGKKTAFPHGKPEAIKLEKNTFLTMDFGCLLDGYCADMTRTVCVGRATDKMRRVDNTVLQAQKAGIAAVHAGVVGKDVDRAAREVIEQAGFGDSFGHSTGHGIGLEVHEAPSFSPREEARIPAGAVLSVEPGIYLAGEFGVRIEDLVVVRDGGCENLNRSPKELIEL